MFQDIVTLTGSEREAYRLLRDREVRSSFPSKKTLNRIIRGEFVHSDIVSKDFRKKFYSSINKQPQPVRDELLQNFKYMFDQIRELQTQYRGMSLLDDPTEL